jgi:nitroreductase
MPELPNANEVVEEIRKVRQARLYEDRPVPEDALHQLLEVARWTGSARNTQPWHFVVVTDKEQLRQLGDIRDMINWVGGAPLAIALVFDGKAPMTESVDEGRVTERLMIAATMLGMGGGTAWFLDDAQKARAAEILSIPVDKSCRSLVAIGYPTTLKDHRENANIPGRKPLEEIVSYGTYGQKTPGA